MTWLGTSTQKFIDWLGARPEGPAPVPDTEEEDASLQTGRSLVERIVRAIELNQSVLLTGPRGCGKSWCVEDAIREAQERGLIPPGAKVFLQGNREIPRDYLAEDEIGFRTVKREDGTLEVIPENRSAPLFTFAVRSREGGEPVLRDKSREVVLEFPEANGRPVKNPRFVLFLDEANRFSDGLLDSLLSVLEERKAVLAGREYRLPVVVCMTMNPPGYDASARRLSPPLAARIGRSFSLRSPDLSTLSDVIVRKRVQELQKQHDLNRASAPPDVLVPCFPDWDPVTVRLACLVTLALWGRIQPGRASFEYLTPATRELLDGLVKEDRTLAIHMDRLASLCRFGPDARAAADWLTAAIGLALEEATRLKYPKAVLSPLHLLATAQETLAHKIYDDFSAASRPELVRQKEESILAIAAHVFKVRSLRRLVARQVDAKDASREPLKSLEELGDGPGLALRVTDLLIANGVTTDEEFHKVTHVLRTAIESDNPALLQRDLEDEKLIEETLDSGQYVFSQPRYRDFFTQIIPALPALCRPRLEPFFNQLQDPGIPFREVLKQNELIADVIRIDTFLTLCRNAKLVRSTEKDLAERLLQVWDLRRDLATDQDVQPKAQEALKLLRTNGGQPWSTALKSCLTAIRDVCLQKAEENGGDPQGFLVRWLNRHWRRELPPEALLWKRRADFIAAVAQGVE